MFKALTELWKYRQLLYDLTARELKIRYRRSVLGFVWSLVTPIFQIVVMTIVVKEIWKNNTPNYSMQFLAALVPWTLFQTALLNACPIILRYREMVKRVWMPTQALPLAVVGANCFHFLLSMVVLFGIFLVVPIKFSPVFLYLFVYTAILLVMTCGLAMLFAALHTLFQDTEFIVANVLQAFYFLTPVMYPASWVRQYAYIYMFNPLAVICEGFRGVLLRQELPGQGLIHPEHLACAAGCALLCFVLGLWFFNRQRWQFPEII